MDLLLTHYSAEQSADIVDGDEYTKKAHSPGTGMEWKTFKAIY